MALYMRTMEYPVTKIVAISLSIFLALVILFLLACRYFLRRRAEQQSTKMKSTKQKGKIIGQRPTPLKLHEVRYQRVPSQFTPVITPSQFTIPPSRLHSGDESSIFSPSPKLGPTLLQQSPKLLRTMSEGHNPTAFKHDRTTPHGKIECFLKYEKGENCLSVQILGKKGHSLSWLSGISNPYIRVTLISSNMDTEAFPSSSTKILNLPSNSSCKLDGITDENLRDCLLKFVVLDFDRFSRSEFVAEVLVPLGDLGDLHEGVTICEELMLQQKLVLAPGGSLLISLCNQCVAQQLQVIILKADGIPSKSAVSLIGSDLCVKITLETSEACYTRKTKGNRKNNSYIFNEKLLFEVNSKLLTDAMLTFEVTRGDSKLRYETKIGVVKLGLDSCQALEMRHWSEMLASPQKQIAEWHQLRRV